MNIAASYAMQKFLKSYFQKYFKNVESINFSLTNGKIKISSIV